MSAYAYHQSGAPLYGMADLWCLPHYNVTRLRPRIGPADMPKH
jgi:hypothetical protein